MSLASFVCIEMCCAVEPSWVPCRTKQCPELREMDTATFNTLFDAYSNGSAKGRAPEEIYGAWQKATGLATACSMCDGPHR